MWLRTGGCKHISTSYSTILNDDKPSSCFWINCIFKHREVTLTRCVSCHSSFTSPSPSPQAGILPLLSRCLKPKPPPAQRRWTGSRSPDQSLVERCWKEGWLEERQINDFLHGNVWLLYGVSWLWVIALLSLSVDWGNCCLSESGWRMVMQSAQHWVREEGGGIALIALHKCLY